MMDLHHQFASVVFPLGFQYTFEVQQTVPLTERTHWLIKDNKLIFAGHSELTPSFLRVGPWVRLEPVAFWDVTVRGYGTGYFGTFSSIIPLSGPTSPTDAEYRNALKDTRVGGYGLRLDMSNRLKAKVGPMILVLEGEVRGHHIQGWGADIEYYWDPSEMILLPGSGWTLRESAMLFGEVFAEPEGRMLWVGVLGENNESVETGDLNTRLGPLIWWKPNENHKIPAFILGSQVWLRSQFMEPWPPYTFLALKWD